MVTFRTGSQCFKASHDTVYGIEEILLRYALLVVAGGYQCRLVADVGYVGSGESRSLFGQKGAVELFVEFEIAEMHTENLLALLDVGQSHLDLTVESSGTHQRLVQYIDAVRSGQYDHSGIGLESVHLGKQLVERVFALVVARESGVLAACAAYGVDLVYEDYARRLLLGLLEEVSDARGAHADEHLHEVRSRDREERHVGFASNGLGQQRLTRSRRAYQQRSLRDLGAQRLILVRLFEEVDYLHYLHFGLFQSGHVLERNALLLVLVEYLRARLAHIHYAAASTASGTAGHAAHEQQPHAYYQQPRQQVDKIIHPAFGRLLVLDRYGLGLDTVLSGDALGLRYLVLEVLNVASGVELHLRTRLGHALEALVRCEFLYALLREVYAGLVSVHDTYALYVSLLDQLAREIPVAVYGALLGFAEERVSQYYYRHRSPEPHEVEPRPHHGAIVRVVCHIISTCLLSVERTNESRSDVIVRSGNVSGEHRPITLRGGSSRGAPSGICGL